MIYKVEDIIKMKMNYLNADDPTEVVALTFEHKVRRDLWALEVLGDSEFKFLFPFLISNVNYAQVFGYKAVNFNG